VLDSRPLARGSGLLTAEVGDELLVYDQDRNVACRLNRTAALVWRHSDGRRTVPQLATVLSESLGGAVDEDLVVVALDSLQENGLLDRGLPDGDHAVAQLSRRRFVRRAGAVGAAALAAPVVQAVVAPTPAAAASPASPPVPTPTP